MNGQSEHRAFITCPVCQFRQELVMPVDACLFFHRCDNCKIPFRPLAGDCCVFCSYGDTLCFPKQREDKPQIDADGGGKNRVNM